MRLIDFVCRWIFMKVTIVGWWAEDMIEQMKEEMHRG